MSKNVSGGHGRGVQMIFGLELTDETEEIPLSLMRPLQ
jgi:hypothetical protein